MLYEYHYRFIRNFWVFLRKQLFHSRFLDMRRLQPTRQYGPLWLSTISYPARPRAVIVSMPFYYVGFCVLFARKITPFIVVEMMQELIFIQAGIAYGDTLDEILGISLLKTKPAKVPELRL